MTELMVKQPKQDRHELKVFIGQTIQSQELDAREWDEQGSSPGG